MNAVGCLCVWYENVHRLAGDVLKAATNSVRFFRLPRTQDTNVIADSNSTKNSALRLSLEGFCQHINQRLSLWELRAIMRSNPLDFSIWGHKRAPRVESSVLAQHFLGERKQRVEECVEVWMCREPAYRTRKKSDC